MGHDPVAYSALLFIYSLAAAVILSIPVELGLLNTSISIFVLAIVIGAGRAVGSVLVFRIGARVEEQIDRWIHRYPRAKPWLDRLEAFVAKRGYWALLVLSSIPFMSDTLLLYMFAVLNPSLKEAANAATSGPATPQTTVGVATAMPAGPVRPGRKQHAMKLVPFVAVNFAAGVIRSLLFFAIFIYPTLPK